MPPDLVSPPQARTDAAGRRNRSDLLGRSHPRYSVLVATVGRKNHQRESVVVTETALVRFSRRTGEFSFGDFLILQADGLSTSTLTIAVRDACGNAVPGETCYSNLRGARTLGDDLPFPGSLHGVYTALSLLRDDTGDRASLPARLVPADRNPHTPGPGHHPREPASTCRGRFRQRHGSRDRRAPISITAATRTSLATLPPLPRAFPLSSLTLLVSKPPSPQAPSESSISQASGAAPPWSPAGRGLAGSISDTTVQVVITRALPDS